MKMEYKLIDSAKKGFILTRKPEIVDGELIITFTGAPVNATAIFENGDGNSLYRQLSDKTCSIPADFIKGGVKVTVAVLDGKANAPKYICEEIFSDFVGGGVVVCPNGVDIPQEIVGIYASLQIVDEKFEELFKARTELNEKLEKLLEGYDVI